ncbi:capsular polysaccharide biosynthesis protein [Roseovarius faecimaris]|uniref:Capsular polysaccharide biosynthesis protein n=1 Tax=Roseovarius faecimaris TaxID=2494550 RepID=A0A6I6IPQ5_9RHOB|nr:capsular polysaccharide biosynthesis protein [Roseovarius faecimaris]QGX99029.1 capsular polysaccharide biosynthesis protein [Roseovarius faecimaris]
MPDPLRHDDPAGQPSRRVFYFNAGFLRQKRIRRMLELAGYPLRLGKPGADDLIAVWGHSPYARRGEAMAEATGAKLIRVEDALLRSVHPGRDGSAPLGLVVDQTGVHFDSSRPSDLETLLKTHPLDDTALLDRARGCIARMQEAHLSKYTGFDPDLPCPDPGYVLVIDQTRGDASVTHGGADANTFREMLYYAQEDNPGARILIKTHPETVAGHRQGYFSDKDESDPVTLIRDPVSLWHLMEGAVAVYTVSSGLGFEAIFAGHKPQVFGQPFYAGWGLTEDRHPHGLPRRGRDLTRAQLFAATMLLYPIWYDPYRDKLCELEDAIATLEAQTRAWREDHRGWTAHGMRLWKRGPLQGFFGAQGAKLRFSGDPVPAEAAEPRMIWAGKAAPDTKAVRVEDGFLRSRGLGAELVPPLSLVCDDLGIYYDPTRESRLERWIGMRADLRPDQDRRAERVIARLRELGLSKYNLGGARPELPEGHRILVPGQVEDDASIRLGAGEICTNLGLLERVRAENPGAVILFKPHPDVEAGLRDGAVPETALEGLADAVLRNADPIALLQEVEEVWTMTSLLGFEALLRDVKVTTTGAPFYAGWGLTRDLGRVPARRVARPGLHGLVHAALIDYPRYRDPVTGLPCPVEVVIDRLATGAVAHPGLANRLLSKLQGVFASYAGLWR